MEDVGGLAGEGQVGAGGGCNSGGGGGRNVNVCSGSSGGDGCDELHVSEDQEKQSNEDGNATHQL